MKKVLIAAALSVVSMVSVDAFAGKAERDFMTNEVQPAVKAAEAKLKSACGCGTKFVVSDTLKTRDDLAQARNIANAVAEGAGSYCTDDASKKAVCQLKTIEVVKGKDTAFKWNAGKGTCVTDGQSYVSWDMITREIDK